MKIISENVLSGKTYFYTIASCSFIDNCARAKFPADADLVRLWKSILCENLSNVDPLIHEKAVAAIPHFLEQYYR